MTTPAQFRQAGQAFGLERRQQETAYKALLRAASVQTNANRFQSLAATSTRGITRQTLAKASTTTR